ncbi:hypothetical protein R3P38DRAFT_2791181 [Favolaschia claudopus]|uniref:Uncharacterized protein n=1 Tax=Favolaschia claudopus TaxID=2862362 RepID=A0AAW0AHK3_9AGAR
MSLFNAALHMPLSIQMFFFPRSRSPNNNQVEIPDYFGNSIFRRPASVVGEGPNPSADFVKVHAQFILATQFNSNFNIYQLSLSLFKDSSTNKQLMISTNGKPTAFYEAYVRDGQDKICENMAAEFTVKVCAVLSNLATTKCQLKIDGMREDQIGHEFDQAALL